jgi:antitoxin ChpS
MLTANLKKVGGSVMLAVPPAVLEQLDLKVGSAVALSVDGNRLVIESQARPKYTLQELLDQCDFSIPMGAEEREWMDSPAVGREIL